MYEYMIVLKLREHKRPDLVALDRGEQRHESEQKS
jgi:hypothetical protein